MPDIYPHSKRSEIMSKISASETKPEIAIRTFLFSYGFRYRKNLKTLPGKPDIVLHKYKTVVFINGCFWHGHSCKAAKLPETKKEFWKMKIDANVERDKKQQLKLKHLGWNIITVWQCEIKSKILFTSRMAELINEIRNNM